MSDPVKHNCFECEEAARRLEKIKNSWARKYFSSLSYFLLSVLCFLFAVFVGLTAISLIVNLEFAAITYASLAACCFFFGLLCLPLKLYRDIFCGLSLYYFKTKDDVLHAHLKKPTIDEMKLLPLPVVAKIGVCGWFRKSQIIAYYEAPRPVDSRTSKVFGFLSSDYRGIKIHKTLCDEHNLRFISATLKDELDERICFDKMDEIFEYLEEKYLPIQGTDPIYKLFLATKNVDTIKKQLDELRERYAADDRRNVVNIKFLTDLRKWIEESKTTLGKSKHAQAIKEKITKHLKIQGYEN